MSICLGGPKARGFRIMRGGIVVCYQYVNHEPALVIFPHRPRIQKTGFIVCLSAAHKYTDDVYLVAQAYKAAEVLGMGTDSFTVYNMARAIEENLEDLVMMKPEPEEKPTVIGEGQILGASGKPIHFDVTSDMVHGNDSLH